MFRTAEHACVQPVSHKTSCPVEYTEKRLSKTVSSLFQQLDNFCCLLADITLTNPPGPAQPMWLRLVATLTTCLWQATSARSTAQLRVSWLVALNLKTQLNKCRIVSKVTFPGEVHEVEDPIIKCDSGMCAHGSPLTSDGHLTNCSSEQHCAEGYECIQTHQGGYCCPTPRYSIPLAL